MGGKNYEIDRLVEFQVTNSRQQRYLVKWTGYDQMTWKIASNIPSWSIWKFWDRAAKDVQNIQKKKKLTKSQKIHTKALNLRSQLEAGKEKFETGFLAQGEMEYDFDETKLGVDGKKESDKNEAMEDGYDWIEEHKKADSVHGNDTLCVFGVNKQQQIYFVVSNNDTSNGYWKSGNELPSWAIEDFWTTIETVIENLEAKETRLTYEEMTVKAEHEKALILRHQLQNQGIPLATGYDVMKDRNGGVANKRQKQEKTNMETK